LHQAKTPKVRHGHMDYLREVTDLAEVWYTADAQRRECRWARVFLQMNGVVPLERFGAPDCACRSQLFFFEAVPSIRNFRRRLAQSSSDGGPVSCLTADRLHESQARC
jgi:Uri superfamily endonuclease